MEQQRPHRSNAVTCRIGLRLFSGPFTRLQKTPTAILYPMRDFIRSSSWNFPGAGAVTLLFAFGCIMVPICTGAKPAATSPSSSKKVTTAPTSNPFLTESALPYQLPPFDKIKDEHFQPALEQGIAEEEKEAEAIAQQTAKPTFENTIVALEKMGQLYDRVRRVFSNFTGA